MQSEKNSISNEDIYAAGISANPAMIHILLGLNPSGIRKYPYRQVVSEITNLNAKTAGLIINENAILVIPPSAGAFVGSDIISCLAFLKDKQEPYMLVDLGTNGELAVKFQGKYFCVSTSAGPAFEGGMITFGLNAVKGAIYKIDMNCGIVKYTTIGYEKPLGICSSGIMDIIYLLYVEKIINKDGSFSPDYDGDYKDRLKNDYFIIEYAENTGIERDIVITQSDIKNFIYAKAAIFAGIVFLCKKLDIEPENIMNFYISGNFAGSYNVERAKSIGLFPFIENNRIIMSQNTSLKGTGLILVSKEHRDFIKKIKDDIFSFNLCEESEYGPLYTASMFIPHTDEKYLKKENNDE